MLALQNLLKTVTMLSDSEKRFVREVEGLKRVDFSIALAKFVFIQVWLGGFEATPVLRHVE